MYGNDVTLGQLIDDGMGGILDSARRVRNTVSAESQRIGEQGRAVDHVTSGGRPKRGVGQILERGFDEGGVSDAPPFAMVPFTVVQNFADGCPSRAGQPDFNHGGRSPVPRLPLAPPRR